ncbi:kinesin-like protein KIF20A [Cloeon dipterum]|uniref:kinesin-like protein KIF20A n=1 Tax=Cloeon dipterum TaxID=197152 RepID=UPI0032203C4C
MSSSTEDTNESRLNVFLRIKPTPLGNLQNKVFSILDETKLKVNSITRGSETFRFSKIFGQDSSQAEIFDQTVKQSVDRFLNGKDCLVFAYGTTNAGKTYSVQGTPSEPGVIPRAMRHIFQKLACAIDDNPRITPMYFNQAVIRSSHDRQQIDMAKNNIIFTPPQLVAPAADKLSISFMPTLSSTMCEPVALGSSPSELHSAFQRNSRCSLWISMLEVYNEVVYDLLAPLNQSTKSSVKIKSDRLGNFCPKDNVEIHVSSLEEANKVLQYGQKQRTTMATLLNINSSRSHCILRVRLLRVDRSTPAKRKQALSPAADNKDIKVSTFMFVDLAGSERVDKAGTLSNTSRARETGNINSSLLVLGRCMEMLKLKGESGNSSKSMMVPYRDSKLTKILQPLLCTPGPKCLLVNINTSPNLFEETHNVLKFSCVARVVELKEPQKPLLLVKKLQTNICTTETVPPQNLSDTNSSNDTLRIAMEQLDEEKRLREEVEAKLAASLTENKKLRESIVTLRAEHYESERALRKELVDGFGQIEQETRDTFVEALEKKENQLITLMEKRMDVQQGYYEGQLAIKEANLRCSIEYCQELEIAVRDWEKYSTKANCAADCGLQEEVSALEQSIKSQLERIKTLIKAGDEKDNKIAVLKQELMSLSVRANTLQKDCSRYKGLTQFIINQYHPSARDSLATHSEEETWALIQKEFDAVPSKMKELEKENSRLIRDLELAKEDYKKLEERRNAQLAINEEELRLKNNQLDMEKREVQALQKQLLGMTPKKLENNTPLRTPMMTALSNSVRTMNLNSPSPCPATISSLQKKNLLVSEPIPCSAQLELSDMSSTIMTRSSGRKRKATTKYTEKENSPLPKEKVAKKRGAARRKLCSDLHPALDSAPDVPDIDFKVPVENEAQKMKRTLRSKYK